MSLLGFASHKGFLGIRTAQFSFADGLQDEAFQYFFQYFFIVYDKLDFPAGLCRIKKGENEKVRHMIENLERKSWGWGRE